MRMPMMQVGIVPVPVQEARMAVPVGVRLGAGLLVVLMAVMLVMHMKMVMFHLLMLVDMLVPFGQMQP
jgi:uncharacterized membrane protein